MVKKPELRHASGNEFVRFPIGSPERVYLHAMLRKEKGGKPNKRLLIVPGVTKRILNDPIEAFAVAKRIVTNRSWYMVSVRDLREGKIETKAELEEVISALTLFNSSEPDVKAIRISSEKLAELLNQCVQKFDHEDENGAVHSQMMISIRFDKPTKKAA